MVPSIFDPDLEAAFQDDGFVTVERLIPDHVLSPLHERFDRLFRGVFETGVAPDEVNWQDGSGDPALTRQICNGWKADRLVASVILSEHLGAVLARLAGWPGARIIQDNLLWKPPDARSVGFHRDNAYLDWYRPQEMATCWIALDPTAAVGGTVEFARGSHRWSTGAWNCIKGSPSVDHRCDPRANSTVPPTAAVGSRAIQQVAISCGRYQSR